MVIKDKKLFFRRAIVTLDDAAAKEIIGQKNRYSFISVLSYKKMELGTGWQTFQKQTAVIDLSKGEEDVFRNFNETVRNEIRKTEKMPDLRFMNGDQNFSAAFDLYKNFSKNKSRPAYDAAWMKNFKIFSAYRKDRMISAIFVSDAPEVLRIFAICSDRLASDDKELYKIIGYAGKRIIYDICRYGAAEGKIGLDVGGANFTDPAKAGITAFKMSFGGTKCDEHTYIYKSGAFSFFENFSKMRLAIKQLFKL
jgi:hypothetical protein